MKLLQSKIPWGVLAGAFGILCFYLTAAVFGVQFVFAQINGQTGQAATIFDTWWQIILFVFFLITLVGFVCSLALFIARRVVCGGKGGNHEKTE